ncbi:MAG: cyclic nucleotide-binding domain-containing protein [Campylobacterales bacterium]|nr:cyclic nucleotide-binding domain-containing protein [Campylobacterales bacterium]
MNDLVKIEVTDGVYWISVPEKSFKILCSSPADSVKHLIKVGLIHKIRKNGIEYEAGPDAILLSDVMVQNGDFANLAEFPILQMLYKRGMIIPNHPGNTGAKPILIGSKEQVDAQFEYIFRGNYGLISEEELIDSGVSPEKAKEYMRLKLKFAFGQIKKSEEFIEKKIVGDEKVEIHDGIFIRRKSLNVFEFSYKNEKVEVDLNLTKTQKYKAPYPLNFFDLKREYFAVAHTGSGDGWDVDRPSMGSIVMIQGRIYLVDAGPNILNVLISLGIGIGEVEGVFHTHSHDDHFAGLAALLRSGKKIKYFATPMVRASVVKKMAALMGFEEDNFFNYFDVVDLKLDKWNYVDGMEVKPLFSPHPVETNIFLFRAVFGDGYKTYAHYADIVSLQILEGMITEDESSHGLSREFFESVKKDYLTKVDLKKVDIGGGMIHGEIRDFENDKSGKILLAHTSQALTMDQREVGSSAALGVMDVLIPSYQDFLRKSAYEFLHSYFPTVERSQLRILLNHPIITLNPEYILMKAREVHDKIYLILSGNVEVLQTRLKIYDILSSGAILGELSGVLGTPSIETYRAASFVNALEIPVNIYKRFVKQNGLYEDLERLKSKRDYLNETWLFGEAMPHTVQNEIASEMEIFFLEDGESIDIDCDGYIYTVFAGKVDVFVDDEFLIRLKYGDSFGENKIFNKKGGGDYTFKAIGSHIGVCKIPIDKIIDIPIVRWKLSESNYKRRTILSNKTARS